MIHQRGRHYVMMTHCKSSLTSYSHVHHASTTFVACTTKLPAAAPAAVHT